MARTLELKRRQAAVRQARYTAKHREALNAKARAHRLAHLDAERASDNAFSARHREQLRAKTERARALARAVADGELARGCIDCGEKDLRVLDFDHVRGTKRMAVSQMVAGGYGPSAIYSEIDKCEVRCANDHRRITALRRTDPLVG